MQFVRPEAFLLLLLWLPLVYFYLRHNSQSGWQSVIAPELLRAFQQPSATSPAPWQRWLLPITLLLAIIALAGPAVPSKTQHSAAQGNLYVVLDNSLSMAAQDVSPDRLTRAKRMIQDWTQSALFDRVSVLTYSGSAHLVTPLTSDVKTMEQQLSALNPFMMPVAGNRADLAFALLQKTLQETNDSNANILWISDDINHAQLSDIQQSLPNAASLTFVADGTAAGGPIPLPNNQGYLNNPATNTMVIAKTKVDQMAADARQLGFTVRTLGADPSPARFQKIVPREIAKLGVQEVGYWLLIPIVLLWLWQQKRGVSLLVVAVLLSINPVNKSYAASWFKNSEQQAYEALQQNDPKTALELSKDPMLAGEAAYQSGNYAEAENWFAQAETADGEFNEANSLVRQQQFQQAIKLYKDILAKQDHAGAKKNLALVEEFLKQQQNDQQQSGQNSDQQNQQQQDQQQQNGQGSDQQQQNQQQQNGQGSDQQQQQNQQQNGQGSDQQQQQNQQQDSQNQQDQSGQQEQADSQDQQAQQNDEQNAEDSAAQQDQQTAEHGDEQGKQQAQTMPSAEQLRSDQQVEALLNQLQQPEGSVLQQKFRYQYQQNPTQSDGTLW